MSPPVVLVTPLRVEAACARRGARRAQVVRTGMGRARSLACAGSLRSLIALEGGAPAVVLGLAGGLLAGQRAGDVIVAQGLDLAPASHGAPGVPAGPLELPAAGSAGLAAALRGAGLAVSQGVVLGTSRLEHGPAARAEQAAGGAAAVDMESWWLAAGVPVAGVVRVLSDVPGQELVSAGTPAALVRAFRALVQSARAIEAWAAGCSGGEISSQMEVQR